MPSEPKIQTATLLKKTPKPETATADAAHWAHFTQLKTRPRHDSRT
ncbi:hypothetical protein [Neisseria cinerea]|nr:hypothetical protein [Neisseria cinerea]